MDAGLGALFDDAGDLIAGYGDDGQVDLVGDVDDGGVGLDAGDGRGGGVDRVEGSAEVAVDQVGEDLVADGAWFLAGADDGDAARLEEPFDRMDGSQAVPFFDGGGEGFGWREVHVNVDHALVVVGVVFEAGPPEHVEHGGVVRQCLGSEHSDATGACVGGELLEKKGAESSSLMVVADDEGHFGLAGVGFGPVVAGDPDDVFVEGGYQGHTAAAVHVGEALDLGRAETGVSPEKTQVDGVGRQMGVEGDQPGAVVGGDGPDVDGGPVGQDRVAFPGGGVDHGGHLSVVWGAGCSQRRLGTTTTGREAW